MQFTYDINLTTAFVGITSAVAFYILVVRLADRTKVAETRASAMVADLVDLREQVTLVISSFGLYREQVAREFCSREILREVETRVSGHIREVELRLTSSIDKIGTRMDRTRDEA